MKVTLVLCGVAVVAAVCTGAAKARLLLVGTVSTPSTAAAPAPARFENATELATAPASQPTWLAADSLLTNPPSPQR